jgi:hypothetical protein
MKIGAVCLSYATLPVCPHTISTSIFHFAQKANGSFSSPLSGTMLLLHLFSESLSGTMLPLHLFSESLSGTMLPMHLFSESLPGTILPLHLFSESLSPVFRVNLSYSEPNMNLKNKRKIWKLLSTRVLRRVVWSKFTDVLETASSSETSVNFYQITRRNIPEDSHLHPRCRENLKSQQHMNWANNNNNNNDCSTASNYATLKQPTFSWKLERQLTFPNLSHNSDFT